MVDIKNASIEELEAELEARIEQKKKDEAPQVKENIDWTSVINDAISRRDSVIEGSYHEDNDDAQYMFEAVMQAVFGEDYFSWENEETA